ncbi:MAG: hypothetical protein JNM12_13885 [Alphaproteobacteria bacterium]|nr:hypothetical protein [Alphaproteobacteria bacterium]
MRFILIACVFFVIPTIAVSETLKMTAPQEGKALGNLERRKSNTAPATIEELFTPKPAAKKPPAAKPDAAVILRDIDAKLDGLQQQIDKLNGLQGVPDEKLLALIDRMNTLSSLLASMQQKTAVTDDGGADIKE